MKLVIAEKPQLGKAIADALPGYGETKDGIIRKGEYVIIWAFGHLLTLKEPEDYDPKFEEWKIEDLPIYFNDWGMKVGKDDNLKPGMVSKAKRIQQIGDLLKQADCVIHAGDVDEEGQLLIDEILRWFSYKGPVWRLDTSNTTEASLRKALHKLKNNKECEADGWSAFGRMLSDTVFGFNLTRYFTKKNDVRLHVGRVQTPTLGLVVQRDMQIEAHKKIYFYELFADLSVYNKVIRAKFQPNSKDPNLTDGKFLNRSYLEQKAKRLHQRAFSDIIVKKEGVKQQPPLPFNLTKLTSYCSKRWGYNPDDVVKITQSLRENHKAITYNRSDCQYLSEEHYREAPETIAAVTANLGLAAGSFDPGIKSRCFNDANITAHFAIIPQAEKVDLSKLTERERNVYLIISHYYLAQFLPPADKERTTLSLDLNFGECLRVSSMQVINPGFRAFLNDEEPEDEGGEDSEEEATDLNSIPAGSYKGSVKSTVVKEKETRPPSRYTQASLAEDMTRIAKYIDDPDIKRLLLEKDKDKKGENGSIGTAATRPGIINQLLARGYLKEKREGKRTVVISTPKGRDFYNMLPDEIKKADMTAKWWSIQEDIKFGAATPDQMAKDVLATVTAIMSSGIGTLGNNGAFANGGTGEALGTCPLCGNTVVETDKAFSCTNKDCRCVFFKENKLLSSIGKKMSASLVKKLLTKGSAQLKDCKSAKTGKIFDCTISVKYTDKYPALDISFEEEPKELGYCPFCGGEVERNKFGNFSCTNWRAGCKFTIYGTVCEKKLTDANVRDLLTKGQTRELSGFIGKKGNKFDAKLVLGHDGKVSFKFVDHPKKW